MIHYLLEKLISIDFFFVLFLFYLLGNRKHLVDNNTLLNTYVNLNLFDKGIGRDNLRKANKGYSNMDEEDVSDADEYDDIDMEGGKGRGGKKKR